MKIGIVAGGPERALASLSTYKEDIDIWIAADAGAIYLMQYHLPIHVAIGDFDSISEEQRHDIQQEAERYKAYPKEKNETDLELAVEEAFRYQPSAILLFGVTAGRLDHELANIQLLYRLMDQGVDVTIVDRHNQIRMFQPGTYRVLANTSELISFVPLSPVVKGLTLHGFYYALEDYSLHWGSTRCISNQIIAHHGTFSFDEGILIMIKSKE
ncbi:MULTISPECIES: thiamine diphosphokinase [Gracilibacillus]|uniref:thiamine diphosphokinase n=1 Tax=Gracilibacillus TaxID=74385 RepID=UPI0008270CFA|nr:MULTISPECIES: thiamine diphosphokinase [Gracilibacillus]